MKTYFKNEMGVVDAKTKRGHNELKNIEIRQPEKSNFLSCSGKKKKNEKATH